MSLNEVKQTNVLVVGIGNPLRSDDGVGPYVADGVEARGLNGVKVWVVHQLNVEDLDRMIEFNKIILVDASVTGLPLDFHPVDKFTRQTLSSSHHLSAETFVNLAKSIYHTDLHLHLCSIRGISFEVGNKISPEVFKRAQVAVELICHSIKG